jgi:hypothetical protein
MFEPQRKSTRGMRYLYADAVGFATVNASIQYLRRCLELIARAPKRN